MLSHSRVPGNISDSSAPYRQLGVELMLFGAAMPSDMFAAEFDRSRWQERCEDLKSRRVMRFRGSLVWLCLLSEHKRCCKTRSAAELEEAIELFDESVDSTRCEGKCATDVLDLWPRLFPSPHVTVQNGAKVESALADADRAVSLTTNPSEIGLGSPTFFEVLACSPFHVGFFARPRTRTAFASRWRLKPPRCSEIGWCCW